MDRCSRLLRIASERPSGSSRFLVMPMHERIEIVTTIPHDRQTGAWSLSDSKSDCDLSFFKNHCICKIVVLEFRIVLNLFGETFHAFHNPNDIAPDHKMCEFRMTREPLRSLRLDRLAGPGIRKRLQRRTFRTPIGIRWGGFFPFPWNIPGSNRFSSNRNCFPGVSSRNRDSKLSLSPMPTDRSVIARTGKTKSNPGIPLRSNEILFGRSCGSSRQDQESVA